jgi:ABC-type branched-subunit amino acid transport system substrate-binding protein
MRRQARLALGAVLGASALLVAACGSDNSGGSSAATTSAGATTTAASGGATTTAASGGATTTAASGGGATTTSSSAKKWPAIPDGPITFGVSAPLTGANAAFGGAVQKAFENVTLAKFNEIHPDGIDGHKVQISVKDDGSDVTTAVNVANQFVADKVAGMVTLSYNPAATPQQIAIFNKSKVPMVAVRGDKDLTDTSKWPYWFGLSPSNPQEQEAAAKWIAAHPEIKTIAVLTDNTPTNKELLDLLTASLKTAAPNVKFSDTASVTPGAVDVSTAIAQLKGGNPDLLYVNLGFAYGPVWQAIKAAGWSPKILTSAGAWYDGYDAMGDLATNAVAAYYTCAKEGHPPFTAQLTDLMAAYTTVFGTTSTNYLTYVSSDNSPLELFKTAIEKNHSIDPDAIKDALETMGPQTYFGVLQYNYTKDNHFGITGDYGAAVCKMGAPFSDGGARIPFVAT